MWGGDEIDLNLALCGLIRAELIIISAGKDRDARRREPGPEEAMIIANTEEINLSSFGVFADLRVAYRVRGQRVFDLTRAFSVRSC